MHVVHEGRLFVVGDAEHVNVRDRVAHHLALSAEAVERHVALLQSLGLLEAHLVGQLHHPRVERALQLARVSFKYLARLGDAFLVVLVALFGHARRAAVMYVILQAGLVFALFDALFGYRKAARARAVELLYDVEHGVHRPHVAVWTVISAPFLVDGARLEYARKVFVGHADRGIRLAVFQQDVVARLVFLYQAVLKQQRVFLGVDHGVRDVVYLAYEHFRLEAVYLLVEIRRHAGLKVLRLAHVDYRAALVVVLVAARLRRHVAHDGLQPFQPLLVFFFSHKA